MKIFVMGAGYVGMALLESFQKEEDEIYISTTSEEKIELLKPYAREVLWLQESQKNQLEEMLEVCDAMIILVAPKKGESYQKTYLDTAKIVSAALKQRKKPFYLLYTSSTSVYQDSQPEWVNEESHLSPQSENAKILIEAEKLYLNWPTTCILRLGGIYGPKRTLEKRAEQFSGQAMSSSGLEPTNHIHLNDIILALKYCLEHRLEGVYNLVNDDHPRRKELYNYLCRSLGIAIPLWTTETSSNQQSGYKVSNQKIKQHGFFGGLLAGVRLDNLARAHSEKLDCQDYRV